MANNRAHRSALSIRDASWSPRRSGGSQTAGSIQLLEPAGSRRRSGVGRNARLGLGYGGISGGACACGSQQTYF